MRPWEAVSAELQGDRAAWPLGEQTLSAWGMAATKEELLTSKPFFSSLWILKKSAHGK